MAASTTSIISTTKDGSPTDAQIDSLEKMLLIGELASAPEDNHGSSKVSATMPMSPSKAVTQQFVEAANALGGRTTMTAKARKAGNVNVKGYKLSPEDLLQMNESERLAILDKVKGGEMTINDALKEVIEHKKRQNCVVM
jgi:hypothetical protein